MALTCLGLHAFLKEEVDIAILETGIGGRFDFTNVVPNTMLCVVTAIDFDHTNVLGNTLGEIAWNKAGIIKEGSLVLVLRQVDEVLGPIQAEATSKHATLRVVEWAESDVTVAGATPFVLASGLSGRHQLANAKLAVEACRQVLGLSTTTNTSLPLKFAEGLKRVEWPGRCQKHLFKSITFYLDGSHTPLSVIACMDWWAEETNSSSPFNSLKLNSTKKYILVFNCTGSRNYCDLLQIILVD